MTASDCYYLGLMLYNHDSSYFKSYAAEWFEAALERLNNEQGENPFTATEIMTYIVKSYFASHSSLGWLLLQNIISI